MFTRRHLLAASASLPLLHLLEAQTATAAPSQPKASPGFDLPAGACDCHVHVHPAEYPMYEKRGYTPEHASVEELESFLDALGLDRVVIVTPSIYGPDNSATLSGLQKLGPRARGVAVIDAETTKREMNELAAAGIRGVRLNLSTGGVNDPDRARSMIEKTLAAIEDQDWHLQLNTNLGMIAALKDFLAEQPRTVVFDHFGGAQPKGDLPEGSEALIKLAGSGKAYVKLSIKGGHREDLSVFDALADALIKANSERMLWGSNWPHPNAAPPKGGTAMDLTPLHAIDDGRVLAHLTQWAPTSEMRKTILTDNPARLYGFKAN